MTNITHNTVSRLVYYWLLASSIMILLMVFLGGLTRLTDAGLSIVEWRPISGIMPPGNEAEWQEEFAKYQTSPEYLQINKGMALSEFKFIFWLEFVHRLAGRIIGLVFLLPFIYLWQQGKLSNHLKRRGCIIMLLGAMQGAMGWYMVKSGLYKEPHVSHFRLAAHLMFAAIIYSLIVWEVVKIRYQPLPAEINYLASKNLVNIGILTLIVCYIQMWLGALVAGKDAGLVYNEFPLMGGRLTPSELYSIHSLKELVFDPAILQFWHRITAYLLASIIIYWSIKLLAAGYKKFAYLLQLALLGQFSLGVMTLLLQVPISLALAHQMVAFGLLTTILVIISRLKLNYKEL